MMDMNGFIQLVADTLFGGDVTIAGIVIYSMVLLVVLALTRKAFVALLVSLPVTFVFTQMNIISQELMIMLIIVAVLGMAYTSRTMWKD